MFFYSMTYLSSVGYFLMVPDWKQNEDHRNTNGDWLDDSGRVAYVSNLNPKRPTNSYGFLRSFLKPAPLSHRPMAVCIRAFTFIVFSSAWLCLLRLMETTPSWFVVVRLSQIRGCIMLVSPKHVLLFLDLFKCFRCFLLFFLIGKLKIKWKP